ncbi:MAG: His/Gly/Thr/Pro-type tRNA ligase C-terminal domain-containing protein, partial [Actinomycetota bacterium]
PPRRPPPPRPAPPPPPPPRDRPAGVKFADADLIGFPVQVVVGRKGVAAGTVDLKLRATGERSTAPIADAADAVVTLLGTAP